MTLTSATTAAGEVTADTTAAETTIADSGAVTVSVASDGAAAEGGDIHRFAVRCGGGGLVDADDRRRQATTTRPRRNADLDANATRRADADGGHPGRLAGRGRGEVHTDAERRETARRGSRWGTASAGGDITETRR